MDKLNTILRTITYIAFMLLIWLRPVDNEPIDMEIINPTPSINQAITESLTLPFPTDTLGSEERKHHD